MDRALASGARGFGFKSQRAYEDKMNQTAFDLKASKREIENWIIVLDCADELFPFF
jgi:hypothetical protein